MDPLSLTASIITVSALAQEVGKTLRKLHQLRHVSDEIHSLVNDVSDLQAVLGEVDRAVIQYQATAHLPEEVVAPLSQTVEAAKKKLLELDQMPDARTKGAKLGLKWFWAPAQGHVYPTEFDKHRDQSSDHFRKPLLVSRVSPPFRCGCFDVRGRVVRDAKAPIRC
jgi:hypothetical protein